MTRVLLLADDTYALMRAALDETPEGREVLNRFDRSTKLPSDRETLAIVRAARAGDDAPVRVRTVVDARDAAREAGTDTREAAEALLFHLSDAGVPPSVLQRWFGYSSARIFQLLSKREPAAV
jgi:hypothetical protein